MSSAVTGKGVPVKVPSRSIRLSVLRLVRMAVAFVVVAGSLGLATVTATAQSGGSSCPSDGAAAYSDVPESSFAYDDSRCLRELGISKAGDTYRPGDDMTRSEMAAFMANAYQALTGMEAPIEEHTFTDIADDPNGDDIARISPDGLGITKGTSPTTYSPNDPVIRGHMALFLTRLYEKVAGDDAPAGTTEFTDIGDRSEEQQAAIGQLFALDVTTGTSDTTYSPTRNVTREEMASFVARMYRALDALSEAPGAPTGVAAMVSDDGDALDVSWTAPEDMGTSEITGYVVQWMSGDDDYSDDNQSSVDGTSTNIDDLTKGMMYTFRVAAMSADGMGDWSDEASATIPMAPGAPTGVAAMVSDDGDALDVSWTAPEDMGTSEITGYVVQWMSGDDDYSDDNQSSVDGTSTNIDDLTKGMMYTFRVAAMSDDGMGDWSDEASATIPMAPGVPTGVEIMISGDDGDALDVSWTAPEDMGTSEITGYVVQWMSGDDDYSDDNQSSVDGTSTNIDDLTKGMMYTFRVAAMSADGMGDWSDEASGNPAIVPGSVGNLKVVPGNKTLSVTWEAPDDGGSPITGYMIAWVSTSIERTRTEAKAAGDALGHTITLKNNAGKYSVTVTPMNAAGDGESATVAPSASTSPTTVASSAPTKLRAAQTNEAGTEVTVYWTAPTDTGGRDIENYLISTRTVDRATGATSEWSDPPTEVDLPATQVISSDPITTVAGNKLEFRVRADNTSDDPDPDTGLGEWATGSITPTTVPSAPTLADADVIPVHNSLQVSWTPNTDDGGSAITGYKLSYLSGGAPTEISVGANVMTHTITGLKNAFTYMVSVKAVNAKGDSPASEQRSSSPTPAPAAPRGVRAVIPPQFEADGTTVDNDGASLDVTWNAPADNGTAKLTGGGPVSNYVVTYRVSAIPGPVSEADCSTSSEAIPEGMTCNAGDFQATGYALGGTNTTRKLTIDSLTPGTSYDVSIQAQNTGGPGPRAISSGTPGTIPNVITSIDVEAGYKLLTVSWAPPAASGSNVTKYELRWSVKDMGWRSTTVAAPRTVHVISGLMADTPYDVQIRAVNRIGAGAWSDSDVDMDGTQAHSGVTSGVPSAPRNVRAVPAKDGTGDSLTISWSKVTASNGGGVLNGYIVEYRQPTAESWETADLTNACDNAATTDTTEMCDQNTTSVTVQVESGATGGTTFLVRVRAMTGNNVNGSSGYAVPVKTAAVPAVPDNAAAAFVAATKVVSVTWTGLTGTAAKTVTSYKINWFPSEAGADGSLGSATVSDNTAGSYTIKGLAPGTYTVRIKAVNAIGESSAVDTSEVTVPKA